MAQKLLSCALAMSFALCSLPSSADDAKTDAELKAKLKEKVKIDKRLVDRPLSEVVEYLGSRWDVPIRIDTKAFQGIGVDKPQDVLVGLVRTANIDLATALERVSSQIKGKDKQVGTYTIRDGAIWIVPKGK
jgi:hypothetical protein